MSRQDQGLPEGIRPQKSEVGKPLSEIRKWELDTAGWRGPTGEPLPRRRWLFKGTLKSAIEVRKTKCSQLVVGSIPSQRDAKPRQEVSSAIDPTKITVREYGRTKYEPWAQEHHQEDTWRAVKQRLDSHIYKAIGSWSLADANDVEAENALKAHLKKAPGFKKNSSRNAVLLNYSGILTHATNPRNHKGGKPPISLKHRIKLLPKDELAQGTQLDLTGQIPKGFLRHKRFSQEEAEALWETARTMPMPPPGGRGRHIRKPPEWWMVLLGMGLYAGCRPAEAAARKWEDYHDGRLEICSQVSARTGKYKRTVKNGVSGGQKLPAQMVAVLDALKAIEKPEPNDFILGMMTPHQLRNRFEKLHLRAFGIASKHYHKLRHTYGSALADGSVEVEAIQSRMRHKSVNTTYGYIHPAQQRIDAAADVLDFSAKPKPPALRIVAGGKS